jgi:hypothetical protein
MRINLEVPEWVYFQFKQQVGEGNMSSYIRDFVLLTIKGEDYQTILEKETDKQALKVRVEEAKDQAKLLKTAYEEAEHTLACAMSDLKNYEMFVNTKKMEQDKDTKIEDDIKFNTMRDRVGDY